MTVVVNFDDLDRLASELRQQAAAARSLRSAIDRQLGSTEWKGLSADRFRGEWDERFAPTLSSLSEELETLGQYVAQKRQETEQADRA